MKPEKNDPEQLAFSLREFDLKYQLERHREKESRANLVELVAVSVVLFLVIAMVMVILWTGVY